MLSYTHSDAVDVGNRTILFRQNVETHRGVPYEKTDEATEANDGEGLPNGNELMQKDNGFHRFVFHVERILCICREGMIGRYQRCDYRHTRTEKNCCREARIKHLAPINVLLIKHFLVWFRALEIILHFRDQVLKINSV